MPGVLFDGFVEFTEQLTNDVRCGHINPMHNERVSAKYMKSMDKWIRGNYCVYIDLSPIWQVVEVESSVF